jgi:hypothetical protein
MKWCLWKSTAPLLALMACGAAGAEELPSSILRCTAIPDDQGRLACFDRATAGQRAPDVVSPKYAEAQANAAAPGAAKPADPPEWLQGTVSSVERRGDGTWRLVLDDGSTWEQSDPAQQWFLKAGDVIELRKGMLGAWFVRKEGRHTALRVRPSR